MLIIMPKNLKGRHVAAARYFDYQCVLVIILELSATFQIRQFPLINFYEPTSCGHSYQVFLSPFVVLYYVIISEVLSLFVSLFGLVKCILLYIHSLYIDYIEVPSVLCIISKGDCTLTLSRAIIQSTRHQRLRAYISFYVYY